MALLTGLVAYWTLDEASGTRNDSFGTNHLTDTNTVGSAAGKISTAADPIAANSEDLRKTGGSLTSSGTSRSVSLWAKPDLTGTQRGVASAAPDAPLSVGPLWILVQKATDVWSVYHGGAYRDSSTPTISAGTWYHLVYTYDAATNAVVLWINGVSRATATAADTNSGTNTYLCAGFSAYFDGLVDECGIWNRALTSDEVGYLYNGGNGLAYPLVVPPAAQASPARAAASVGHGQFGLASGLRTFADIVAVDSE